MAPRAVPALSQSCPCPLLAQVAYGNFTDQSVHPSGFGFLEIVTNSKYPDNVQARCVRVSLCVRVRERFGPVGLCGPVCPARFAPSSCRAPTLAFAALSGERGERGGPRVPTIPPLFRCGSVCECVRTL